jgi:DNA-binding NtrC family response regulator
MERLIERAEEASALARLVGRSPAFARAVAALPAMARGDAAVLVSGETGTGKELAARALHYLGPRAGFPFVAVNCGALPEALVEDELFGHEKGAFTDARAGRPGLVAEAEKGTLFLDEIDALSRKAQVTLLRVLQDRRYRPVGAGRERQADVRIVAATNAPLDLLVREGAFRSDLYFRLCVFTLHLPPLRERREDIPALAAHFLEKHAPAAGPRRLAPGALAALLAHDWPGNVRELENCILRGSQLAAAQVLAAADLGLSPCRPGSETVLATPPQDAPLLPLRAMKERFVEAFEHGYLTRLMTEHRGNVTRAARAAGKERRELGKLLKRYRIDPAQYGAAGTSPAGPLP